MTGHMKPVYLLAGGRPPNRKKQDSLIQAVVRESGKTSPTVGYIGTASGDDSRFLEFMAREFKESGAFQINHAVIASPKADLKKAKDILKSSDIIFAGGGDVEVGVLILQEKKMDEFLRELYREGKVFFGISAGSIMLAKEWVRWRDPEDDSTAELFPCLDIAPVICDTHCEQDGWEELQVALKLEEDNTIGYGIVSGTAIKVFPDGSVEALGGVTHQYIRHGARVDRISDILPITDRQ
jgi:dipeptidase E